MLHDLLFHHTTGATVHPSGEGTVDGWFGEWFADAWFPSVWFAPGDESGLLPEEIAQVVEQGGVGGGRKPKKKRPRNQSGIVADLTLAKLKAQQQDDEEIALILAMAIGELV